jgi:hypothetical protein
MASGTLKWADPDYATLKCVCGSEDAALEKYQRSLKDALRSNGPFDCYTIVEVESDEARDVS